MVENISIGILDSEGINNNPLNDEPYSDEYKKWAKIWKEFPAYQEATSIIDTIKNNQVTLVVSGTGSGKTVLFPKYALHALDYKGKVAVTLPKQIIAKSAAEFAATTLDVKVGEHIGYQYKGSDHKCVNKNNNLLYATDGTIVARLLTDPQLLDFDVVVVDEAHERKVQIDFLMYLLRNTLTLRKDFKVIIMSATINSDLFKNYFNEFSFSQLDIGAKTNYPIKSEFLERSIAVKDYIEKGIEKIIDILKHDNKIGADILFFVTSVAEAINVCKKLSTIFDKMDIKIDKEDIFCVEVYSGIDAEKQQLAQDKDLYRKNTSFKNKVVVATNVAESSLTIDGIKYVIDSGYELKNYFDSKIGADVLEKRIITHAQAKQRMGRTGRTQPGTCYHLYTEDTFNTMERFPQPDIRTSDITSECLKLMNLEVGDTTEKLVSIFMKFIEPPREIYIRFAIEKLRNLDLIKSNKLTELGKLCVNMRLDPEMSIALVLSTRMECSHEVSKIMALQQACKFNIDELFRTPADIIKGREDLESMKKKLEDKYQKAKNKFNHKYGDHMSLLNIYEAYYEITRKYRDKPNKIDEWCHKHFIKKKPLIKAMQYRRRIRDSLRNIDYKGELEYDPEIDKNPALRTMYCLSYANRFNKISKTSKKYMIKENEFKIPKSSFLYNQNPSHIIYQRLFISMGFSEFNIVSKIPSIIKI